MFNILYTIRIVSLHFGLYIKFFFSYFAVFMKCRHLTRVYFFMKRPLSILIQNFSDVDIDIYCLGYIYRPQTKLREGYVFTGVCDSVHMGGWYP